MNVHHNDYGTQPDDLEFFALTSQYGDGPIQFRDPAGTHVQLVGHEGAALYIRDDETNEAFCPGGAPLLTAVKNLKVRYRAESTEIASQALDLAACQRIFVPRHEPVQIWTLSLQNLSDRPRSLSLFAGVKFDLAGCVVEVEPSEAAIMAARIWSAVSCMTRLNSIPRSMAASSRRVTAASPSTKRRVRSKLSASPSCPCRDTARCSRVSTDAPTCCTPETSPRVLILIFMSDMA